MPHFRTLINFRPVATLLYGFAASAAIAAVAGQYSYDRPGDKRFVSNTGVLERTSPTGASNQSYKICVPVFISNGCQRHVLLVDKTLFFRIC